MGVRNTGEYNTGDFNAGNCNTGDWNAGDRNTGYSNTGDRNTGDWNTGDRNTGYSNTGDWNAGDRNTGDWNAGYWNTGDWNTGNYNTGDRNTGDWNTGDWNTGHFNTTTPGTINVFNKPCSREDWDNAELPKFLLFQLTEWVNEQEMTDEEKEENTEYEITGGYLKVYEYKEAFQNSFNKLDGEEREEQIKLLEALPNFDYDIFVEISGIDYRNQPDTIIVHGVEYVRKTD